MIKLKSLIKENLDLGSLENDYSDIKMEVEHEFQLGQKHQSWRLIPARDLILLWIIYAKYGRVDEEKIIKIWDTLKELVIKILLNTYEWQDENPEFYGKENSEDITDDDRKRHAWFISDLSGNKYVRNWGEEGGNARYSDCHQALGKYLIQSYSSKTPEELLMNIDKILNFIHGLGNMAKWFVEGGTNTLSKIRDYQVKGITIQGKLSETFLTSFERLGRPDDYVEIFINPPQREMEKCKTNGMVGAMITDTDCYIWNRNKTIHDTIRRFLIYKKYDVKDAISILLYFKGNNFDVFVTDNTRNTKWHHNKNIRNFIVNHPFFKYKKIMKISYYDEDIVGKWDDSKNTGTQ